MQTQLWMNDATIVGIVGDWWTQELALYDNATNEMNVATANIALEQRECKWRVADCREAEGDDNCDWLVVGMHELLVAA